MKLALSKNMVFTLMIINVFNINTFAQNTNNQYFTLPLQLNSTDYLPNTIYFKVKKKYSGFCDTGEICMPEFKTVADNLRVENIGKLYPMKAAPKQYAKNSLGAPLIDLSRTYKFKFSANISLEDAINEIYATGLFEYVEPVYVPKAVAIPSDTSYGLQYYLNRINASAAWDIQKGDTAVVIAIIDTGMDTDHEDLIDNIAYNYNDPINGVDDDNDGYIDNYAGWDMNGDDNNVNGAEHGTLVGGSAGATADNITGIAGVAFNCKLLPVKIANNAGDLTDAEAGVVYAADHGADVINCSYSAYGYNQTMAEVYNYAIDAGSIVIAAASNEDRLMPYGNPADDLTGGGLRTYPASFNRVLSVGGTNENNDNKWGNGDGAGFGSNYGYNVDVFAPGNSIYTTQPNDRYKNATGTSLSAPIVAGVAALIKSKYPNYGPEQIRELLRVTADNIDGVNNASWAGLLGSGRVNMVTALTDTVTPSIRYISNELANTIQLIAHYDTLKLSGTFMNYLTGTNSLDITLDLVDPSNNFTMIDSIYNVGVLNTLAKVNNRNTPFQFIANNITTASQMLFFKYSDAPYLAKQPYIIKIGPSIVNEKRYLYNAGIIFLSANDTMSFPFFQGTNINIAGDFTNYLRASNPDEVFAYLSSNHPNIKIMDTVSNLGTMLNNAEVNSLGDMFSFQLQGILPLSEYTFPFEITYIVAGDTVSIDKFNITFTNIVGIEEQNKSIFNLKQNYPNPITENESIIEFSIPERGNVNLILLDAIGNRVKVIVDETMDLGVYTRTISTENLSSGIYFYQLSSGSNTATKKLVVIK